MHRDVSNFVEEQAIKDLHHERGPQGVAAGARSARARGRAACVVHIGVGDFAHVVAHYAKELRPRRIYLTDTERSDGSALSAAIAELNPNAEVPVSVIA